MDRTRSLKAQHKKAVLLVGYQYRSSLYYRPVGIDDYTLMLMHELDKQYTETPFYGVLKMTAHLRSQGHQVNPKRVRKLLRQMGLEAVYPKPKLSQANSEHKVFPYLLRYMPIERCNQVWSTDITKYQRVRVVEIRDTE